MTECVGGAGHARCLSIRLTRYQCFCYFVFFFVRVFVCVCVNFFFFPGPPFPGARFSTFPPFRSSGRRLSYRGLMKPRRERRAERRDETREKKTKRYRSHKIHDSSTHRPFKHFRRQVDGQTRSDRRNGDETLHDRPSDSKPKVICYVATL